MTHICVSKLTIIGSDNGLSPGRRQAIIRTNVGILLIRTLGTNFSEILGEIHSFSFSKMHLKMSSAKWRLFGLGLNELIATFPADVLAPNGARPSAGTVLNIKVGMSWAIMMSYQMTSVKMAVKRLEKSCCTLNVKIWQWLKIHFLLSIFIRKNLSMILSYVISHTWKCVTKLRSK